MERITFQTVVCIYPHFFAYALVDNGQSSWLKIATAILVTTAVTALSQHEAVDPGICWPACQQMYTQLTPACLLRGISWDGRMQDSTGAQVIAWSPLTFESEGRSDRPGQGKASLLFPHPQWACRQLPGKSVDLFMTNLYDVTDLTACLKNCQLNRTAVQHGWEMSIRYSDSVWIWMCECQLPGMILLERNSWNNLSNSHKGCQIVEQYI